MPKTIAITPSWYWPSGVPRVLGTPPFSLADQLVHRWARRRPDEVALVDAQRRITGRELVEIVAAATTGARSRLGTSGVVGLIAGPSVEGAIALLALAEAGVPVRLITAGGPVPDGIQTVVTDGDSARHAGIATRLGLDDLIAAGTGVESGTAGLADRLIGIDTEHGLAWHSHRSVLGGAHSLRAFFGLGSVRPWLTTVPVSTWEGIYGITVALAAGATVVMAPPGDSALEMIAREGVGVSYWHLAEAYGATKDAKRQVKAVRDVQDYLVLATPRRFDPDDRHRVGKLFGAPALTMFGLAETGPIFAAHPSWYLDESIGIPISNAFVVPADPRSGRAIATLWELVESAMVTVACPGLFEGYETDAHQDRFVDGRFVTGVVASSDANGMIYLLPD